MNATLRKWLVRIVPLLVLVAIAVFFSLRLLDDNDAASVHSGNGRLEATEIDIAAKLPGRIKEILVREGDFVKQGQVLALMDSEALEAQLRQTQAQLGQAQSNLAIAHSQLTQRQAEKNASLAVLAQRQAELGVASKRKSRSAQLVKEGASSRQEADDDEARVQGIAAAVNAARAQVAATEAAIATAKAQLAGAESAVAASEASVARIRADLKDCTLTAPRDGRIQYRVAQTGEVIAAGGRVLNMLDLSDVYMSFFLPTAAAGKLAIGDEVRLVLDAAPQYVIPAQISFVADVAQFTPKTVETAVEREKLMFRVRAQIAPALLQKYLVHIKTGLPGMAYVRADKSQAWPKRLETRLPP